MNNNVEGKIAVITGASRGLGEAVARLLSVEEATVVMGARRIERIQPLAEELPHGSGKTLAVATAVTHCNQVKKLTQLKTDFVHDNARFGVEDQNSVLRALKKPPIAEF